MYRYDEFDAAFVRERVAQFADQVARRLDGSLTEVNPPVGPLPLTFQSRGVGREVATVTFPSQGDWTVQLDVQTSAINEIAVSTTIPVR